MNISLKDLRVLLPGIVVYIVGKLLGGGGEIILTSIGKAAFIGGAIALTSTIIKQRKIVQEQEIINTKNNNEKEFYFLKIFSVWTIALSITLVIIFVSIGSGESIKTVIFSSIFLAILLSLVVTFIRKWIFERKKPQIQEPF